MNLKRKLKFIKSRFSICDCTGQGAGGQPVRLYEFVAWPDALHLPQVGDLLDLVSHVAEWCRRDIHARSTLLHVPTLDDLSRVALVCAVWTVLDRIHAENLVDVYMAARYVASLIPSAFCSLVSTIRDAILTCARKPTRVTLIYRTEPTTKKCKTEKKLKVENRYAQK